MRTLRLFLFVTSFLILAVPCARAQDVLETTSGKTYQGKVTSNDGDAVEITTTDGATMKIPVASLTPASQYRLKLAAVGDDGKSRLDLADWCVDNKLYMEARTQFRKALTVAPDMEEEIKARLAKARTKAANELLDRSKKLQAANKPQEARQILSTLVQELPLEDASKEAARLLADETTQRKQDALKRGSAPSAGAARDAKDGKDAPAVPSRSNGEPFSEATRKLFQPSIDAYHELLDDTQDGLVKGGSQGIDEFEKALKAGDRIQSNLEKLRSRSGNDAEVAEALELATAKLEEAIVDARINLADAYMLRTSYNQASEAIRLGLADYPKNERLRGAMDRVTAAATDGDDGWVLSGRRR